MTLKLKHIKLDENFCVIYFVLYESQYLCMIMVFKITQKLQNFGEINFKNLTIGFAADSENKSSAIFFHIFFWSKRNWDLYFNKIIKKKYINPSLKYFFNSQLSMSAALALKKTKNTEKKLKLQKILVIVDLYAIRK